MVRPLTEPPRDPSPLAGGVGVAPTAPRFEADGAPVEAAPTRAAPPCSTHGRGSVTPRPEVVTLEMVRELVRPRQHVQVVRHGHLHRPTSVKSRPTHPARRLVPHRTPTARPRGPRARRRSQGSRAPPPLRDRGAGVGVARRGPGTSAGRRGAACSRPGRPRSAPQRTTQPALWISIGRYTQRSKIGRTKGRTTFGVNAARAGRAGPLERLKPRAEDPSVTGGTPGFMGRRAPTADRKSGPRDKRAVPRSRGGRGRIGKLS